MLGVNFFKYYNQDAYFCTIFFTNVMLALNSLSPREKYEMEVNKHIRFDNMENAARDYVRDCLYDAAKENGMCEFVLDKLLIQIGNTAYQFTEDSLYMVWGLWGIKDEDVVRFPLP